MKSHISPNPRSTRNLRIGVFLAVCLAQGSVFATDTIWQNSATITSPPQVDALNFVNSGIINIFTSLPFETSNTRNYTNSGSMSCNPGWFFDDAAPQAGLRRASENFVNLNDASITAQDPGIFIIGGRGGGALSPPSYLWISATNIVNKGTLTAGANGWLKILGTNVDVARSALEVPAIVPTGGAIVNNGTNYINDVGINDVWWGQTNVPNMTPMPGFSIVNIYNGNRATAPPHSVQIGPGGGNGNVSFSVPQPFAFGYSNTVATVQLTLTNMDGSTTNINFPTNIVKQAAFVGISDPTLTALDVRFLPSTSFGNPFQTICVRLAVASTNVITQAPDQTTLYFYDLLGSQTNRGLAINLNSPAPPTFVYERPVNYILSRLDFRGMFGAAAPGNITPDPLYLWDPSVFAPSNSIASGDYAGYQATVDNLASEPPPTTAASVTNFPGRVEVYADTLDFRNTRVRGEGEIVVQANHLLSSAGAAVDCENLSYELGSTNGKLNVVSLAKQSVIRMNGNVVAWSGLWTNTETIVLTNNYSVTNTVDTNGVVTGTNAIQVPLTNSVVVFYHAFIFDADNLVVRKPVITWNLVTHSADIVISDPLSVVQNLFLDGQSFTLNGVLNLTSTTLQNTRGQSTVFALNNWIYTNAPGILFFTNNGTLTLPGEGHFADDRSVPYSDFINTGTLRGGSLNFNSLYLENDGLLAATVGPFNSVGNLGLFQNGQATSGGDIDFFFNGLKFSSEQVTAAGALNFYVTNGLSDGGPTLSNSFRVNNGFNLFIKPNGGDLLGTLLQDQPPNFVEVDHVWAGADRGVSASGYANNAAVGQLVLTAQSTAPNTAPLFFFAGANGQNGLYVDLLDLTSLGSNYLNLIEIDPSLTIYYAAAKVGFTPANNPAGIPQEPEEFLDGQFGGHLRWVSSFAGPNSSVDVVINGVTVAVNRALRFSKIIDSNGNGVPNFFDPFPFNSNPLVLRASLVPTNQPPGGGVGVSWNAAPQLNYQVEFSTDVQHPNWQPLTRYTSTANTNSTVTIWDRSAPVGAHRFYRVRIMP